MKILYALLVLCVPIYLHCQLPPDHQWYVKDTEGILNGDCQTPLNPGSVYISGVNQPDPLNNMLASNALFLIYEDGNYATGETSTPPVPPSPTVNGYRVTPPSGTEVNYLYFTNKYEGDDPFENVKVDNGSFSGAQQIDLINGNQIFYAHQDIITSADIVVVLKVSEIVQYCTPVVQLCYHKLISNEDPQTNPGILQKSSPFRNNTGNYFALKGNTLMNLSSAPAYGNPDNECIELDLLSLNTIPGDYLYMAFQAPYSLDPYISMPSNPNNNHHIVFEILGNSGKICKELTLEAPIRSSHDPNFTRVHQICKNESGEQFVFYEIQFQNDSERDDAVNLELEFELPQCLDPNRLCIKKWKAGNTESKSDASGKVSCVHSNGQTIKVIYDANHTLCNSKAGRIPFNNLLTPCTTGSVYFCVKVKEGYDATDAAICDLQLIEPHTYFNGDEYDIVEFIDLELICESRKPVDAPEIVHCQRPESIEKCNCNCNPCPNDDGGTDPGPGTPIEQEKEKINNGETPKVNGAIEEKVKPFKVKKGGTIAGVAVTDVVTWLAAVFAVLFAAKYFMRRKR